MEDGRCRASASYDGGGAQIGVALEEALTNALFHGNLEISSDLRQEDDRRFYELADRRRGVAPYKHRRVEVRVRVNRRESIFTIKDEGPGFDTSCIDRPMEAEDMLRVGGRGLLLIRAYMDDVRFNARGNQITMIKKNRLSVPDDGSGRASERPLS